MIVITHTYSATAELFWQDNFTFELQHKFDDMRDWCIINLEVDSWEMENTNIYREMNRDVLFSHTFTFENDSDATAFLLKFPGN